MHEWGSVLKQQTERHDGYVHSYNIVPLKLKKNSKQLNKKKIHSNIVYGETSVGS